MKRLSVFIPGLILIVLGGWFLAQNLGAPLPDIWTLWPAFIVFGGVNSLIEFFARGRTDTERIFNGVLGILIGGFFFMFTLGYWQWAAMGQLWPILILILSISFFAQWLTQPSRTRRLIPAIVTLVVGVFFLPSTMEWLPPNVSKAILQFWPALLIVAGVIVLAVNLFRKKPTDVEP